MTGHAAFAQDAGWRRAGGGLFPGREISDPVLSIDPEFETADDAVVVPAPLQPFAEPIAKAAARHGLDPKLLHALVIVESRYQPKAVSPVGAAGLTQLMKATGASLGVQNRFDVEQSLDGGAAYLAQQLVRFGDVRLALAAYNAGPGRVARLGRVPNIPETQNYVASVVECYLALTAGRSVRSSATCRAQS
ncbi:MAG TPA: lytic transglycosylase domain-containing protein [Phenylobacterium sp.]